MYTYKSKGAYQYKILACYGGEPFFLPFDFYSYFEAQQYVHTLIDTTDKRLRFNFYVDNLFYKNDVPVGIPKQRYYKVLKRKITDFIDADCDFETTDNNIKITNSKNNILQFRYKS